MKPMVHGCGDSPFTHSQQPPPHPMQLPSHPTISHSLYHRTIYWTTNHNYNTRPTNVPLHPSIRHPQTCCLQTHRCIAVHTITRRMIYPAQQGSLSIYTPPQVVLQNQHGRKQYKQATTNRGQGQCETMLLNMVLRMQHQQC